MPEADESWRRRDFIKTAALGGLAGWTGVLATTAAVAADSNSGNSVPVEPPDREAVNLKVPGAGGRKIGWAVVGLGTVALDQSLPAFLTCTNSRVTALVSGHREKAEKVAAFYGVEPRSIYNYENYDALKDAENVDAIYIALPNSMHAEYAVRGLRAGKHVLCEKPLAVTVAECEQMIAAAKAADRKLGVAYRLCCEPMNLKAMQMAREGDVGKLKVFESGNCQTTKAPNVRLSAKLGGGPVEDLGIYCIHAARTALGEEPVEVSAISRWPKDNPDFREVPETVAFTMVFPSGVLAQCECSFGTAVSQRYRLTGTDGFIEMDPSFAYRGLRLRVQKGGNRTEVLLPEINQFTAQFDAFSSAILNNTPPPADGAEGLVDIRVIVAVKEAAETGQRVRIG